MLSRQNIGYVWYVLHCFVTIRRISQRHMWLVVQFRQRSNVEEGRKKYVNAFVCVIHDIFVTNVCSFIFVLVSLFASQ